jgi:hypothetical protein
VSTYGIGQDPTTGQYTVIIDGVIVATYPALKSALAHIDARRDPFASWDEGQLMLETIEAFLKEKRAQGGRA